MMSDIHSPETRIRMMFGIKEKLDQVLTRYNAVIFCTDVSDTG